MMRHPPLKAHHSRSASPPETLGKLVDNKFRLLGWCVACWTNFVVDVGTLVAQRGRNCRIADMAPVPCPGCGRRRTEHRLIPPMMGYGMRPRSPKRRRRRK
jgi:hypothetical protein